MDNAQKRGLESLKQQYHAMVDHEKGVDVPTYLEGLHKEGVKSFKRSVIPSVDEVKGNAALNAMKKVK